MLHEAAVPVRAERLVSMKIGSFTYIAIGLAVSIIFVSYAFFYHWKPNTTEIADWKTYRNNLRTETGKEQQVFQRVRSAEEQLKVKIAEWRQIVAVRTPPPSVAQGGIDLSVTGFQLVLDTPKFRNSMQRAVNQQMRAGGVRVIQGPTIASPPGDPQAILAGYFNYPPLNYPVAVFDLGRVTVEGTFDQISQNMAAWSRMPHYLAVADGLTLTGTSPRLTGAYAVSLVAFIQTPRPVFPPIVSGQVVAAPGAPGGRPGGAAPGVPGATR